MSRVVGKCSCTHGMSKCKIHLVSDATCILWAQKLAMRTRLSISGIEIRLVRDREILRTHSEQLHFIALREISFSWIRFRNITRGEYVWLWVTVTHLPYGKPNRGKGEERSLMGLGQYLDGTWSLGTGTPGSLQVWGLNGGDPSLACNLTFTKWSLAK